MDLMLNGDAYKKREKIFDKSVWINTKPLYIDATK